MFELGNIMYIDNNITAHAIECMKLIWHSSKGENVNIDIFHNY